ncbi:MAG: Stp1/IreP family PP2C-type Ser/Thr phosphatase, partial [Deltaproteobacteria bacterium]|nr:Stp1/IreP family PP2C-type Ser/Thr phosphatase [Deltaproteobacteria bacterium]
MLPDEQVAFWAATDVGRVRDHNEDNFLADRNLGLFAVADGMGGHAAGEVASTLAVQTLRTFLNAHRDVLELARGLSEESEGLEEAQRRILSLLEDAVNRASQEIWRAAQVDEAKRGMGTTLSALLLGEHYGYIAHVGDSRIYLLRMGEVQQLTEDHSLVNALLKEGRLKPEDVPNVDFKNAVTRAVGVYEGVDVDTLVFPVLPGDQFLLASDGLTGYLESQELPAYMNKDDVKAIPPQLIEIANERGGKDNITSVVVRVVDVKGVAEERFRELNFRMDALSKMPFFKFLAYSDLLKVFVKMETVRFPKGKTIFGEGSSGADLFLLLGGKVRVHRGDAELAQLGPGEFFGEMALIDQAPRSASISTIDDALLLRLDRKTFFTLIRRESELAKKVLWNMLQVLSARLRTTNQDLAQARGSKTEAEEEIPIDTIQVFGGAPGVTRAPGASLP